MLKEGYASSPGALLLSVSARQVSQMLLDEINNQPGAAGVLASVTAGLLQSAGQRQEECVPLEQ